MNMMKRREGMNKVEMTKKKAEKRRKRRKKKNPKILNPLSLNVSPFPILSPPCPIQANRGLLDAKNHSCPAEKHHFDECAARVTKAQENPDEHKGHHEDCAEEFLHLMHCVDKTIAEPLFRQLK
jgi:hypothetical protein